MNLKALCLLTAFFMQLALPVGSSMACSWEGFDKVATEVRPAVVYIITIAPQGDVSIPNFGSGFVASSSGGILTNYHVVERAVRHSGSSEIRVVFYKGTEHEEVYRVKSVKINKEKKDVALLVLDVNFGKTFKFLKFSITYPSIAEGYGSFGFPNPPLYLESGLSFTPICLSSTGLTSISNSGIKMLGITGRGYLGGSGSPIVNRKARVIGISTEVVYNLISREILPYGMAIPLGPSGPEYMKDFGVSKTVFFLNH